MYSKKVLNGYYYTTSYFDKPLKYCPYGSAGVLTLADGTIQLKSYTTIVIELDANGWLTCTGTYSATTRKHIGAFLKEYAPAISYYDVKAIAGKDERINIYTGELEQVA